MQQSRLQFLKKIRFLSTFRISGSAVTLKILLWIRPTYRNRSPSTFPNFSEYEYTYLTFVVSLYIRLNYKCMIFHKILHCVSIKYPYRLKKNISKISTWFLFRWENIATGSMYKYTIYKRYFLKTIICLKEKVYFNK